MRYIPRVLLRSAISAILFAACALPAAAQVPAVAQVPDTKPIADGPPHTCATRYFPATAFRNHEEGLTVVKILVGADGTVKNVSVFESSGYDDLDQAALKCMSKFLYRPATKYGVPVEAATVAAAIWCQSRACFMHFNNPPLPKLPEGQ
jgi:TonB family protein